MCPHTTIYVSSYFNMRPHTTTFVSSYYYICPHTTICVLILLRMCPHTTIYAHSHTTICVLILLYMCLIILFVRLLMYILIPLYMRPQATIYVSSYYYICPHTTFSSYYDICILIPLYMCPHAPIFRKAHFVFDFFPFFLSGKRGPILKVPCSNNFLFWDNQNPWIIWCTTILCLNKLSPSPHFVFSGLDFDWRGSYDLRQPYSMLYAMP
jgi:hypothetical protein